MKIDPKIAKILAKSKASLQSFESEVKSMSATAAKIKGERERAALAYAHCRHELPVFPPGTQLL